MYSLVQRINQFQGDANEAELFWHTRDGGEAFFRRGPHIKLNLFQNPALWGVGVNKYLLKKRIAKGFLSHTNVKVSSACLHTFVMEHYS